MNELILDIKIEIASKDEKVWYNLYRYDEEFKTYTSSGFGVEKFKELYTKERVEDGSIMYYLFNRLYRIIYASGNQYWFQYGNVHRGCDLPAIIKANGDRYWYQHGDVHRENDLPAIIKADGTQEWCQHGKRHRNNDQPAIIYANGDRYWYKHGNFHRKKLPAIIMANGTQEWYKHGKRHKK